MVCYNLLVDNKQIVLHCFREIQKCEKDLSNIYFLTTTPGNKFICFG